MGVSWRMEGNVYVTTVEERFPTLRTDGVGEVGRSERPNPGRSVCPEVQEKSPWGFPEPCTTGETTFTRDRDLERYRWRTSGNQSPDSLTPRVAATRTILLVTTKVV